MILTSYGLAARCFVLVGTVVLLAGCLSTSTLPSARSTDHGIADYVSEVDLPEAKAAYAFAQYRLLVAEGRWDVALDALERAVALDPDSRYLRMNLAKAYLHNKQTDLAVQTLQKLLEQHPEEAEAQELLGDLLLNLDQPDEAARYYRLALQYGRAESSTRLKLATALARSGELADAIDMAEGILQRQPDSLSALLTLARFYREDRQLSQAVEVYRRILELRPGQVQILLELGLVLQQQGRIEEALTLYRDGQQGQPGNLAIRERLVQLLISEKQYLEALRLLQEVNEQHPEQLDVINRIGLLQLEMQRWAEAELTFRKALRVDPDHERSRYYLGMALSGAGDIQAALQELASIGEDSPIRLEAVSQRAYLYQQNEQIEQAIELLREELSRGLTEPILYFYLSSSYATQGQLEQAAQVLHEALERYPEDVKLRYQLGIVYEKMDDRVRARQQMERILQSDPDHPDALNYMAYLRAETGGDLEQALREAKRALAVKEAGYILDTLGWVYYKLGRFAEGRQPLEQASRLRPDDTVILEHLGDLYRALNLWSLAAETYRKILELDPLAEQVEEKLKALPQEPSP